MYKKYIFKKFKMQKNGMSYLEHHKLIYRDVAARNILVGDKNIAKVADFNMAQLIEDDEYHPEGMTNQEAPEQVYRAYRMPKPSNCPDSMYEMMMKCWDRKAKNRPTFEFLYGFFDDYFISTEPYYYEEPLRIVIRK